MKHSKIILSIALSSLLILGGCGGGGGSDGTSAGVIINTEESGFIDKPTSESEAISKSDLYHQKIATSFIASNNQVLRSGGLLDIAAEVKDISTGDPKYASLLERYDEEVATLSKLNAQLLINAANLQTLNSETAESKSIRNIPKDRFFVHPYILAGIGIGLVAYTAVTHYKTTNDALIKNARNNILNVAGTDDNGRKRIILIMITKGIDISRDSTLEQINEKIDDITTNDLASVSREGLNYATSTEDRTGDYVNAILASREKIVELAVVLGGVAIEGAVAGVTLGSGSAGSALTNKTIGTGVDVITTVTSTDPISLIKSHVTTTVITEKKETIKIEKTDMNLKDAKDIVVKIAKDGPGEIKVKDVEDSQKAILSDIAKNDGDDDDNTLSVPIYATTQSYDLKDREKEDESEPAKKSGTVKVYEEYLIEKSIVVITNGKEINHMAVDFIPYLDEEVIIELDLDKPAMTLNSTKTSEDDNAIFYSVTATLTGIKEATTITINPTHASVSPNTKILSANGSVTWSVKVLRDDASITITRSDNGAQDTLYLKGTGEEQESVAGEYDKYFSYKDNIYCYINDHDDWSYATISDDFDQIGVIGTTPYYLGPFGKVTLTGYISDDEVDVTVDGTLHYRGTISSGTISGWNGDPGIDYCTGSYTGHIATKSEIEDYD